MISMWKIDLGVPQSTEPSRSVSVEQTIKRAKMSPLSLYLGDSELGSRMDRDSATVVYRVSRTSLPIHALQTRHTCTEEARLGFPSVPEADLKKHF